MKARFGLLLVGCVLLVSMSGCMNKAILDSYESYVNTTGKEYLQYVDTKKTPDGKVMDDNAVKARHLNQQTQQAVILQAREYYNRWYIW